MTVFLSYFISLLIRIVYFAALIIGGYFIFTLFVPEEYFEIALIGWAILAFAGYLAFAPILTLANRVLKEHLFEDIVLDPAVAARINEKVNISVCNGKKVSAETVSQNLASLFVYTEDPYHIIEETERKSQKFVVDIPKPEKKKKHKATVEGAEDKEVGTAVKHENEENATTDTENAPVMPEINLNSSEQTL